VADIFVSYTSKDRDWAFWIGQELEKLGHVARIDAWEIPGGGNIMAWMLQRLESADHTLCVISPDYYKGPFASAEFQAALWAAQEARKNFVLPVRIADCELQRLVAPLKRCDLFGVDEDESRARFTDFLKPAGKPSTSTPFPGGRVPKTALKPKNPVAFPGTRIERSTSTISNIPINVPRHFIGREGDLVAIETALEKGDGRAAVTALHGLRGVGKTVLAAAYAERHADRYRATWWIRAETESTMRADLVGLGVRLDWLPPDTPEEPGLKAVVDRLRDDGDGILLVYDNANSAREFEKYAPRGGTAHVIVTSNAPDWRGVAQPVEIEVWSSDVGADYLIERTGRDNERDAALALSDALGGLPLAHEQAAAYCERLGIALSEYAKKISATPGKFFDDASAAPVQYHNGLTVAKTFSLAIDQAAKLHPAAEPLIVCAALLAPEPIPLFLFSEAHKKFDEPLASLDGDGLDEAVAALRTFALLDRETISDERDPKITTDCIRLHRLVRQIAAGRSEDLGTNAKCRLIAALAEVYPSRIFDDPNSWPRARRLDAFAIDIVSSDKLPPGVESEASLLLKYMGAYRQAALGANAQALPLLQRALAMCEVAFGPQAPNTATALNDLARLLRVRGDLVGARPYFDRALAIWETALGPDHPYTAMGLGNLGALLAAQGDLAEARRCLERALAIFEKKFGGEHPDTATTLGHLGGVLLSQGDPTGARLHCERVVAIYEDELGSDHPYTATALSNLGHVLQKQGDLVGARASWERALAIREKILGADHPDTATSLEKLGYLLRELGDLAASQTCFERSVAIRQRVLGPDDPATKK
jgi:tetratricopeptide (TPR) repeat protein